MDTIVDLAPMLRSSIGFDHFFSVLDHAIKARELRLAPSSAVGGSPGRGTT